MYPTEKDSSDAEVVTMIRSVLQGISPELWEITDGTLRVGCLRNPCQAEYDALRADLNAGKIQGMEFDRRLCAIQEKENAVRREARLGTNFYGWAVQKSSLWWNLGGGAPSITAGGLTRVQAVKHGIRWALSHPSTYLFTMPAPPGFSSP